MPPTAQPAQPAPRWPIDNLPIEEVLRSQGIQPVSSLKDLAYPDLWDSDEEYAEFLADLYASRQADVG